MAHAALLVLLLSGAARKAFGRRLGDGRGKALVAEIRALARKGP